MLYELGKWLPDKERSDVDHYTIPILPLVATSVVLIRRKECEVVKTVRVIYSE